MARELIAIAVAATCAAGCRKTDGTPAPAGQPLAGKAFYRVDAAPPAACAPGATCEARLVLTALGDYHVNKDYPFKFLGEPAPAVPVDGEGAFAIDDARHLTMTVKFRPAAAGTASWSARSSSACAPTTPARSRPRGSSSPSRSGDGATRCSPGAAPRGVPPRRADPCHAARRGPQLSRRSRPVSISSASPATRSGSTPRCTPPARSTWPARQQLGPVAGLAPPRRPRR